MTFLNPLVLIGLASAAIPIILHLLNLRKIRTIEFSTLTFLKELQQTKIRRLKLRQILLLVTRTLLIIFIILSFARPALKGSFLGSLGTHAHSSVILILDDSFSMSASDDHGERFKQAKEAAGHVIDLLKEGDEIYLLRLSDVPQPTISPATHDFKAVRTIISESQVSYISRSMEDALRLAAKLLQHSANANKEIYVVGDMQRTHFPEHQAQSQDSNLMLFDERDNFFFMPIGSKEISNTSVDSLKVITAILEKDKPVTLYASIKNFSNTPLTNTVTSVYLENIRVAQRNVSAYPWGSASTEFVFTPKRTGFIEGYVDIENDAIEADNKQFFTLFIPDKINVALVGESESDTKFISVALNSGNDQSNRSLFEIRQVQAQKFPLVDLKGVDVLVYSNVKSYSENDTRRIRSFIDQGGGFLFFPGDATDIRNLNSTLLSVLDMPPIVGLIENTNSTIGKIDFDHPVFTSLFEKEHLKTGQHDPAIGSPSITKTVKYRFDKKSHIIISLADGTPLLAESNIGTGKILFFSVAPNLSWTDFPLKGIFAPLIYRSMIYSASKEQNQSSYSTGETPIISLRNKSSDSDSESKIINPHFRIVSPDGSEQIFQPAGRSNQSAGVQPALIFSPQRLSMPGIYKVFDRSSLLSLFSVKLNPYESDARKISNEDFDKFLKRLGINPSTVTSIRQTEQLQSRILQSRFGVELWKYCIGLALLLAIIEMIVARDSRKAQQQKLS